MRSARWIQQGKGHDDLGNGSSQRSSRDETLTVVSSRKRRGAGDTEYRQLLRANLCFSNILFIQGWGKLKHEMTCESKGQVSLLLPVWRQSPRGPGRADLYPVSWSPCLVPVLALLPLRVWRGSPFSPPSCWSAVTGKSVNQFSASPGNIFQQGEEACQVKEPCPDL